MIIGCRPAAKDAGIAEGNREDIYDFFIGRVRYVVSMSRTHSCHNKVGFYYMYSVICIVKNRFDINAAFL